MKTLLLALGVAALAVVPALSGAIAPPPISTRFSVTPVKSSSSTGFPAASRIGVLPTPQAFVPVGTPTFALVNDPCTNWMTGQPTALRHPRCPTAVSAAGWMGR
jgi:hypothetical protein